MVKIQEYVDIKDYSTLRVGGQFRYFVKIENKEDLQEVCHFAQENNISVFVLGGGSNVVFSDGTLNVVALKIEIKGFELINSTDEYTDIKIGAGEIWDEIVEKTVEMDLSGLESLSAIPGTVGASPVQNIGAYGSEVKDTILEVEAYKIETGEIITFLNSDCKFGYRDSIFKGEAKGKYIITAVTFRLGKGPEKNSSEKVLGRGGREPVPDHFHNNFSPALSYPGVLKYFEKVGIENPDLKQIRNAIIEIRKEKLPNPKEIPNVGSFFKNPIVPNKIAISIKETYPDAKFFPIDDNLTKVPAGWLIENSGLKGTSFSHISVYDKNALVLVNIDNATSQDIISARDQIIKIVFDKFGITLEQEPEII